MGVIWGSGKARVEEGNRRPCTVVILYSETDLEEPFTAGERTSRRGLILGARGGPRRVIQPRSCTLVVLFSKLVLEEPFTASEGKVRVLNEAVEASRPWGNRGSRRRELVTIEVQACWAWEEPAGSTGKCERSGRQARIGEPWRKLPRNESLKTRNSSGSVTS
jgi:hypothetical protein